MKKHKGSTKESKKLPGYPHYPASDDILNNNAEKVEADLDKIPRNPGDYDLKAATLVNQPKGRKKAGLKNEADLTIDDRKALGDKNLSMDIDDDDDELRERIYPVDMAASDLDIPGAELDDENEFIGEEDEENNFYSLGGDEHD